MEVSTPVSSDNDGGSSTLDVEAEQSSVNDGDDVVAEPTSITNKPKAQQRLEKRRRKGLFVFSALTATLYAGAWFSWGPLQLLLEARGVFDQLCIEGEPTPCPAQTTRLLTVPFVAQFAIVLSPVMGIIADKYGPFVLMCFASACGIVGLGLMTIATGFRIDNLIFVAFFLIGVMALSAAVNTVQVGMLFGPVTRQRVISALNTLFDAGLLTYLALWGIQEATGCSLEVLLGCYTAVGVFCFAGSINYWRVVVPVDVEDEEPTEEEDVFVASPREECSNEEEERVSSNQIQTKDEPSDESDCPGCAVKCAATPGTAIVNNDEDYVLIADRPPMQQLRSRQFLTLSLFFAIHATRDMFNLTTARDFLAFLGDDETGNKYLTIYTLLTPASILGLPILDFVLTRHGYHAGLQTVNGLALVQGIIMVSSDNLNVQVLGFIFASFFRCFMYTICLGILPAFLGTNAVGKGSGIMPCAAGLLSLVNIPLASWAVNSLGGNFFYPNLMYTLVVLPCIYLAWSLGQGMKREDKAKNRLVRSKRDKQEDEGHSVSVQVNEGQSACEKPLNADKIE
jgi:MFS family permease